MGLQTAGQPARRTEPVPRHRHREEARHRHLLDRAPPRVEGLRGHDRIWSTRCPTTTSARWPNWPTRRRGPLRDRRGPTVDDLLPELVALRRDLHAHPELAFEERRTAGIVAAALRAARAGGARGHRRAPASSARCATAAAARSVGLRADMDALPIAEQSRLAHASRIAGVHHGCGHDGHTAMLLGAARQLARTRRFDGTVHFIFQPAEEGRGGARVMVEEGLFERFPCDAVYALHNWPELPLGHAQTRPGPIMAAADRFDIVAARPRRPCGAAASHARCAAGREPARRRSSTPSSSRRIDPAESAVLSVTRIAGGAVHNVLPAEAAAHRHGAQFRRRGAGPHRGGAARRRAGVALAHGVAVEVELHALLPGDGQQRRPRRSSRSMPRAAAGLQAERCARGRRSRPRTSRSCCASGPARTCGSARAARSRRPTASARCTTPATTSTTTRCPRACAGSAPSPNARCASTLPSESNMSITVLRQTATLTGLQDQGTPARPKSAPPCRLSGIDVSLEGAGDNGCGVWECTPGRFERQLDQAEVMHIVAGRGAFTPAGGEPIEFRTGDTLFFPARTARRVAHRRDVAQSVRRDGAGLTLDPSGRSDIKPAAPPSERSARSRMVRSASLSHRWRSAPPSPRRHPGRSRSLRR